VALIVPAVLSTDVGDAVHHVNNDNKFLLTITVNPSREQVRQVLDRILTNPHPCYRHVIYSGPALGGSGCWLLRDGPFTHEDFASCLPTATTKNDNDDRSTPVYLSTFAEGNWNQLPRGVSGWEVVLNPELRSAPSPVFDSFVEQLSRRIGVVEGGSLLGETGNVGSVYFSRPTVYVFPAGDGGSSLFFGILDLSVVCDAGVGRRPAFWDFVRHLANVDVLIGTHAGADNILGLGTFIERQLDSATKVQLAPKLGHVILNGLPDVMTTRPQGAPGLLVHLPDEVAKISNLLHEAGIPPHICCAGGGGKTAAVQTVELYNKIAQGSVELYVAQPVEDSRELKEFRRACTSGALSFPPSLTSAVSIVAALVWKPHTVTGKPVRIFLPGSAPQAKLHEALDRLRALPVFKTLSGSIEVHQAASKPTASGTKPTAKPIGSNHEPRPPQAHAVASSSKFSAPTKRGDVGGRSSVPSSKGGQRKSGVLKTEPPPASKTGRVISKPSQTASAVKHVPASAASGKAEASAVKTTGSAVASKLPGVKGDEAPAMNRGLEEVALRESIDRDSLEPSNTVLQADSLLDDRVIPALVDATSTGPDASSAGGNQERTDTGALPTDMNVEVVPDSPLAHVGSLEHKAMHSTPIAAVALEDVVPSAAKDEVVEKDILEEQEKGHGFEPPKDEEVFYARGTAGLEELIDKQTVVEQEIQGEEVHQDVGLEFEGGLVSGVQQFQTTASIPDEGLGDQEMLEEDVDVADIEPSEGAVHLDVGPDFDENLVSIPKSIPDEYAEEEKQAAQGNPEEDIDVVDTEPDEGSFREDSPVDTGYEIDGKHSHDLAPSDFDPLLDVYNARHAADFDKPIDDGSVDQADAQVAVSEFNGEELRKEIDADKEEAVISDTGIIPQGLPSPQKEAEWRETEKHDPEVDGGFPRDGVDHSTCPAVDDDDDAAVENLKAAAAASHTCDDNEYDDFEKTKQDDDVIMTQSDELELERLQDDFQRYAGTTESNSTLQKPTDHSEETEEMPNLPSEMEEHLLEDNTEPTSLSSDQRAEEIADVAVHDTIEPEEVHSPGTSDEISPDKPPSEKESTGEELESAVTQEESVPPTVAEPESDIQADDGDHVSENQDLPSATTNGIDDEIAAQQMEPPEQPVHHESPLKEELPGIEASDYIISVCKEKYHNMKCKNKILSGLSIFLSLVDA